MPTDLSASTTRPTAPGATRRSPWRTALSRQSTGAPDPHLPSLTNRNVGLFKYWTIAQVPNFLLAAPVLAVSLLPTLAYFQKASTAPHTLLPFHIHHLFLTLLLIFASHAQIALRVCITDPVVWWNVAAVAVDWAPVGKGDQARPTVLTTAGKLWIGWVVVYGTVSLFLWAGHYPPA